MVRYWNHATESPSPTIQDTLELYKQLRKEGKTSWFTIIVKISELIHNSMKPCFDLKTELKKRPSKIVINMWYTKRNVYSQGKLKLYASLKERSGFEQYLSLNYPKLQQAITKIRISAHEFPTETGRYENKNVTERLCPLCCKDIGDECHHLITFKSKEISSV